MFKDYLLNMSEYELENQIEQILNYSPNFFSDNKYGVMFMLSIYSNILREYGTPLDFKPKFCNSIDDSIQCIFSTSNYSLYIENLILDNKNSFILAPLISTNHLFTCLIHNTNNNYECTIINKGASANNSPYKKYIIPKENMKNILPILGFLYSNSLETKDIYKIFSDNSISILNLNITSSRQKINNCYYKELEAGLKYAYSNSFVKNFSTPKWPLSTLEMHQKYLDYILSCDISNYTKNYIKTLYKVYTANKTFRSSLKLAKCQNIRTTKILFSKIFKSRTSNVMLSNLDHFKHSFGFDDTKKSTFSSLYDCLSLVDLRTLKQNFSFFQELCLEFKLDDHMLILDVLKDYTSEKKVGLDKISSYLETFFPHATHELNLEYSHFFNKLGNKYFDNNNLDTAIKCFDKSLSLNPNDVSSFIGKGIVYCTKNNYSDALSCFSKASYIVPNSEIILEKVALCHILLNDKKNLINTCTKILKINPTSPLIDFLKNEYTKMFYDKNRGDTINKFI